MINKVNKLKVKQIGIEVRRYGIKYRVALPVFNSNKDFLGVFEFGINVNYILDIFKDHYSFETILLLKKDIFPKILIAFTLFFSKSKVFLSSLSFCSCVFLKRRYQARGNRHK